MAKATTRCHTKYIMRNICQKRKAGKVCGGPARRSVKWWQRWILGPGTPSFPMSFTFRSLSLQLPGSTWFLLWLHLAAVALLGRCLIACLLRRLGAQAAAPHEHHALTLQTTRMMLPHEYARRWCRKADACGFADNVDEFALLLHFLSGSSAVLMYVCTYGYINACVCVCV